MPLSSSSVWLDQKLWWFYWHPAFTVQEKGLAATATSLWGGRLQTAPGHSLEVIIYSWNLDQQTFWLRDAAWCSEELLTYSTSKAKVQTSFILYTVPHIDITQITFSLKKAAEMKPFTCPAECSTVWSKSLLQIFSNIISRGCIIYCILDCLRWLPVIFSSV